MTQPLTLDQVAEHLQCSVRTVRREIVDGRLRAVRIRQLLRIDPADLADYIASQKKTACSLSSATPDIDAVLANALPVIENAFRFEPADQCAVYFLINVSEVVYVGQSINFQGRIAQHYLEGKRFTHYAAIRCAQQDLREIEARYITALQPRLNIQRPSPISTISELRAAVARLDVDGLDDESCDDDSSPDRC